MLAAEQSLGITPPHRGRTGIPFRSVGPLRFN
jgi:hypothetical protein